MHRRLLLVVAACSGRSDSRAGADRAEAEQRVPENTGGDAAPRSGAAAADPWAAPPGAPISDTPETLVVDDAGAEPRRQVRYTIGTVDREVAFLLDDDGQRVTDMRYRVRCSPCTYEMTRFTVHGDARQFAAIAKQITGQFEVAGDGAAQVRPRWFVHTTPSTPELFELSIVRFPSEPIGIGARWTVSRGTESKAFTVRGLSDRAVAVEITALETADGVVLNHTGTLDISLADPVARGTLQQRTTIAPDPQRRIPAFDRKQTLTLE